MVEDLLLCSFRGFGGEKDRRILWSEFALPFCGEFGLTGMIGFSVVGI